MFVPASLVIGLCVVAAELERPLVTVPDSRAAVKSETEEQRNARHAQVAEARSNTVVILHRGAWEYAPENTLSAIRAGLELGATGVELDFRRTADGVIVLFHDERIERLLDGVGQVRDYCYEELLLHTFQSLPAPAAEAERVPILPEVLKTIRDQAGLLHLDIKDSGIDGELLAALRAADMVDHVVTYNDYNSEVFQEAGIAKLPFKGSLMDAGRDTDLSETELMLKRPGSLIILDDPRTALTLLGKRPTRISPKPWSPLREILRPPLAPLEAVVRGTSQQMPVRVAAVRLAIYAPGHFAELASELSQHPRGEIRQAIAWNLGMLAKHRPELVSSAVCAALLHLLSDPDITVRAEAGVACGRARIEAAVPVLVSLLADRPIDLDQWTEDEARLSERRATIEARSRYAFALGIMGVNKSEVIDVLVDTVRHRAVHRDVMLVGVDGAMAASALGKLRTAEAVGTLRDALFREDPTLAMLAQTVTSEGQSANPTGWMDLQIRTFVLSALAEIGGDEAFAVLEAAVNRPETASGSLSPDLRRRAAQALTEFREHDAASIVSEVLAHRDSEVRRSGILACLKRSDLRYRELLKSQAPWAVSWWDAQHPTAR